MAELQHLYVIFKSIYSITIFISFIPHQFKANLVTIIIHMMVKCHQRTFCFLPENGTKELVNAFLKSPQNVLITPFENKCHTEFIMCPLSGNGKKITVKPFPVK